MQSRWESLVEAKVNLAVGFGVAWVANVYVAPLLGVRMTGTQGVAMVVMFSVISLIRQYAHFGSYQYVMILRSQFLQ